MALSVFEPVMTSWFSRRFSVLKGPSMARLVHSSISASKDAYRLVGAPAILESADTSIARISLVMNERGRPEGSQVEE